MEGWSLFDQYGSYDVPFSQSQSTNSDVDMENANAIDIPATSTTVGGASDSDGVDLIGEIVNVAQHLVPGGRAAVAVGNAIGNMITGRKRKRGNSYNGPPVPETPPHRMGQDNDGSDGGDGGPPPAGGAGNLAANGAGPKSQLCCCPCDPKSLKYSTYTITPYNLTWIANNISPSTMTMAYDGYTLLNGLAIGTDYGQRIGRKINLRWIRLRLCFTDQSQSTNIADHSQSMVRVVIFYDKQANRAYPDSDASQLMEAPTKIYSLLNLNNRHRFITFLDKTICVPFPNNVYGTRVHTYDWAVNLRMLPTVYSGTNDLIASITTGSLLITFFSTRIANNASVPSITNHITVGGNARLCYVDS